MPIVLSLFSRHHRRSPATSLALLVATSLSTSAVHPPSPFSLSSRSRCRPTPPPFLPRSPSLLCVLSTSDRSLSTLASSTVAAFSPSPPPSASSSVVVDAAAASSLSSLLLFLRLPDILLWVISASARTSMSSKLVALDPPPPLVRSLSLFSPSASAPSSLIDAAAVASFTVASSPPTKTSCRRRLPYSSSTDVVATSLFLHRCPASPPATQEDPRQPAPSPLLVSASVRCHGLEPKMGIG